MPRNTPTAPPCASAIQPSYPQPHPDPAVRHRVDPGYPRYIAPGALPPLGARPSSQGRVYINAVQYFAGIALPVWVYQIGGYQVAEKWLKDRRGRQLTVADIRHYQQICAALAATGEIAAALDRAWSPPAG